MCNQIFKTNVAMVYINKNSETIYVDFAESLDSEMNVIGTTWEDYQAGAWVLLSSEQVAFHETHPEASAEEVFRKQLFPLPSAVPDPEPTPEERLEQAREKKIGAIYNQDHSTEVFTVNGMPMWLSKNTRASLAVNTLPAEKSAGHKTTTLWYVSQPPVAISVPIAWLEEKLVELELYAKATYDTTQRHLSAVYSLSTLEAIESYDPTVGYPEKLAFVLP